MKCIFPGVLLVCSFLYFGCSKPRQAGPQLPPLTHTGANALGFRANGKIYATSGTGGQFNLFGQAIYSAIYSDSETYISGSYTDDPPFKITMGSKFNFVLGTYKIESTPYFHGAQFNNFTTDSTHGGTITYTYYDRSVIAGTFAFDVTDGHDSVIHVTDGRFDIKMQ